MEYELTLLHSSFRQNFGVPLSSTTHVTSESFQGTLPYIDNLHGYRRELKDIASDLGVLQLILGSVPDCFAFICSSSLG